MQLKDYIGETTSYDKKLMLERKDPTSWLKSISAFANTQGSKLLFGVANDGSLAGLVDVQDDAEFISETIKMQMDPVPAFKQRCTQDNCSDESRRAIGTSRRAKGWPLGSDWTGVKGSREK